MLIVGAVLVLPGFVTFWRSVLWQKWDTERLLSKTDHRALLAAGREILRQVPVKPDPHTIGYFSIPGGVQIPEPIRKLRPLGLSVSYGGYLYIMMHGGMGDYPKVYIYPEGFVEPWPGFRYGSRKLIDGLWYHDSGCGDGNSPYDKYLDGLIARNKYRENQQAGGNQPR
jgi:hypothetical protein